MDVLREAARDETSELLAPQNTAILRTLVSTHQPLKLHSRSRAAHEGDRAARDPQVALELHTLQLPRMGGANRSQPHAKASSNSPSPLQSSLSPPWPRPMQTSLSRSVDDALCRIASRRTAAVLNTRRGEGPGARPGQDGDGRPRQSELSVPPLRSV